MTRTGAATGRIVMHRQRAIHGYWSQDYQFGPFQMIHIVLHERGSFSFVERKIVCPNLFLSIRQFEYSYAFWYHEWILTESYIELDWHIFNQKGEMHEGSVEVQM